MAEYVYSNGKCFIGGYDFSGKMNAIALSYGAEMVDKTGFGNSTRIHTAGPKTAAFQINGFWDGIDLDAQFHGNLALSNIPVTVAPENSAEGSTAFAFQTVQGSYIPGAPYGEMLGFEAGGEASDGNGLIRGIIGFNGTVTANGNGTAFNLGAVSATQKLYASLHVLGMSAADSIVVKVQSDDASGFLSPIDRVTFPSANAIGSQWATPVAGAITDTWWRVNYAVTGTGVSIPFIVFIGIQ